MDSTPSVSLAAFGFWKMFDCFFIRVKVLIYEAENFLFLYGSFGLVSFELKRYGQFDIEIGSVIARRSGEIARSY
ncbi:hypothetical protein ACFX1X_001194 [Malus domestica]